MTQIDEIDKRYFLQVTEGGHIGGVSGVDISKSCDICNEGRSFGRKFRLHLYIKGTYTNSAVACFNCGYSGNMYSYLKDYHPTEFVSYMKEKRSGSFNSLKSDNTVMDMSFIDTGCIQPINNALVDKIEENIFNIPKLIAPIQSFGKIPIEASNYLKSRGIEPLDNWVYSKLNNKIKFNGKDVKLSEFIIIPFEFNKKWFGFQALAWREKKFFVYLVEGNEGLKVWNINNIDIEKPVYIFESIYDAISSGLDNIIAQIGTKLSQQILDKLKEPVFCLDNMNIDEASLNAAQKYANDGYKVFIWPLQIPIKYKDTNDLLKAGIPKIKITNIIKNNIYSGMEAILKLKLI